MEVDIRCPCGCWVSVTLDGEHATSQIKSCWRKNCEVYAKREGDIITGYYKKFMTFEWNEAEIFYEKE